MKTDILIAGSGCSGLYCCLLYTSEDSFLIEAAGRYNIKGKAYIETPKKYYFTDLGLRNARINFRQFEQTHSMENVIYNELRMRGYNVDVGIIPPFCRIPSAVEAQKILP